MSRRIVVEFKYAFVLSEDDGDLEPLALDKIDALTLQIMTDDIAEICLDEEAMKLRTVIRIEED